MSNYRSDARVTPYPGVPYDELLKHLRATHTGVTNIRSKSTMRAELVDNYLTWIDENVRMLRHRLAAADIDRLLLTRRYWAIQASPNVGSASVVDTEIDDREAELTATLGWISDITAKWTTSPGRLVVADTSVFCQHADRVENIDFAGALGSGRVPIRLMVPILVLDELEGLKQSNKRHTRWRAAHTLGKFDEVLDADGMGLLRPEDSSPIDRGELPEQPVYLEVFFDPAGHRRLPINDDELIDRALAIQAESGKQVTFLSFDTAQTTRAKFAGLAVKKLREDPVPEPARE